jgi:uracil-DNA glycosylase
VFQARPEARVLIVGQAPGRRVHETGRPFDDPSGVRLRRWLGVDEATFYDPACFAIVPMGFCYPGTGRSGDLPPRRECAATWRDRLLQQLPRLEVTVLMGRYAIDWHLPAARRRSIADVVADWRRHAPALFVAPHPSPRNQRWLQRHPEFEREAVPALREAVAGALEQTACPD